MLEVTAFVTGLLLFLNEKREQFQKQYSQSTMLEFDKPAKIHFNIHVNICL